MVRRNCQAIQNTMGKKNESGNQIEEHFGQRCEKHRRPSQCKNKGKGNMQIAFACNRVDNRIFGVKLVTTDTPLWSAR